MTTGRKIRRVRMDQELSQRELAQRAGLSMNAISLIERELRTPGINTLAKIAYALGVSPGELIEEPTLPKVDAPSLGQPETRTVGVLAPRLPPKVTVPDARGLDEFSDEELLDQIGRASCRERV